ncbi:hypothetical protein JCM10213_009117 [Rhodosporidiobolus nylandii]
MSFPRSQRFRDPPPPDVPPPGAYDVPVASPEAAYKKGALGVAQAGRFREGDEAKKPDTFGLYATVEDKENLAPGAGRKRTTSALGGSSSQAERERHRQQLDDLRHRLQSAHEKELGKLQAKLERSEKAREEAVKEKSEGAKEASGLKSEIRHLTSKLTKTESLLTKHQSTLPLLQTKLADLQSSNEASRQRKEAEIASLTARLTAVEGERDEKAIEVQRLAAALKREQEGRREQAEAAAALVQQLRAEARDARLIELHQAHLATTRLSRQLDDRSAQVTALAEYASGLEARLALSDEQRRTADEDRWAIVRSWRMDRELLVGPERGEKEWRQRARADARESEGLREQVESLEGEREVVHEGRELGEKVWERRRKAWEAERKRMKVDYEVVEGELDLAVNDEIPRLVSLLSASESSLTTAREAIANLESDVSELQQRLVDEVDRLEGSLEEQRRIAEDKMKEAEKERVEKKRVVGLLAQTRASEGALRGEVDVLAAELSRLTPLVATTSQQQQTIDHLARLSSAAEAESRQLMEENAELMGHGNQQQKIRHVAQLREELAESRRKHLSTTSALSFAEQRIAALESELSTYRAVPSSSATSTTTHGLMLPPPPPSRSRVSRPQMADALSASTPVPAPRLAVPPPPPVVIVEPSPSPSPSFHPALLSASAAPPLTRALSLSDDAPILPPQLAKSQPSLPSAVRPRPMVRTASTARKAVKGRLLEEPGSTSVRMEGRMSVSELFN